MRRATPREIAEREAAEHTPAEALQLWTRGERRAESWTRTQRVIAALRDIYAGDWSQRKGKQHSVVRFYPPQNPAETSAIIVVIESPNDSVAQKVARDMMSRTGMDLDPTRVGLEVLPVNEILRPKPAAPELVP